MGLSYYIAYDPQENERYPQKLKKLTKLPVKWMLSVLFLLIAGYIALSSNLLDYILPGDPEVTAAAFSQMVEQVKTGESVRNAVICFVEQIVTHGA